MNLSVTQTDCLTYRLSWGDWKAFWDDYMIMKETYWSGFEIFLDNYSKKISATFDENVKLSEACNRTLYVLETTQNFSCLFYF